MTVTSFAELAGTIAANWKSADKETKYYCVEVAHILKERHTKLTMRQYQANCTPLAPLAVRTQNQAGGICCLSTIDSVSPRPTEEAKPRNADSETKDTDLTEFGAIFCLPAMNSVSPGPKNDTKQRTAMHAFGNKPSHQDHSMNAPKGIFVPVAHGQDTMNSRDGSRTWSMNMIYQYHHDQVAANPNATILWGNDSLNLTTIDRLQPTSSGDIHKTIRTAPMLRTASMPIMTGSAVSQIRTEHQDVQQEFHEIMNASRLAFISNMMILPSMALMPDGIRCFGAEQPSPNNRRYSAPEYQNRSELERSRAIYNIQELDITDSNIFDMWLLS